MGRSLYILILLLFSSVSSVAAQNEGPPIVDQVDSVLDALDAKAFRLNQASLDFDEDDIQMFAQEFAEDYFHSQISRFDIDTGRPSLRARLEETTDSLILHFESFGDQFSPEDHDEMLRILQEQLNAKLDKISASKDFQDSQGDQKIAGVFWAALPGALSLTIFFGKILVVDGGRLFYRKFRQWLNARGMRKAKASGNYSKFRACGSRLVEIRRLLYGADEVQEGTEEGKKHFRRKIRWFIIYPTLAGVPIGFGTWGLIYEDQHLYDGQEDLIKTKWKNFFEDL